MNFLAFTVFLVSSFLFASGQYDPTAFYSIQVADGESGALTVRGNAVTIEPYDGSDAQKFHVVNPSYNSPGVLIVNVQATDVTCVEISGNDCSAGVSVSAGLCNIVETEIWNIASNSNGVISSSCNDALVMQIQPDNTVTVEETSDSQTLFNITKT